MDKKKTQIWPSEVKEFEAYEDGSGAPAIVSSGRFTYAFDYLSEERITLLTPTAGSMKGNKAALKRCKEAYRKVLEMHCPAGWFARNMSMYRKGTT